MKKNDLIKKLQEIKGNPEILLWNGFVGDYMNIGNIVEDFLTKYTKEFYTKLVLMEDSQTTQTEIEKYYSNIQYEYNQFIDIENCSKKVGMYKKKRVVFIDAKKRGINTFDGFGNISY